MDFHQIRGFLHVVQRKSVSVAAKQLHISQPALSRQIASLERDLGAKLFKRVAAEMRLTTFGEVFLPEAYRIADDVNHAMRKIQDSAQVSKILRIGHDPILMSAFMADAILAYSQQCPDVHIEMTEAPVIRQIEILREGALDIVCTHAVSENDLALDRIARVPLLQVTALGTGEHKGNSGLRYCRDRTFIIPDRKHYPHGEMIVREACRRAGFEPKIVELGGMSTVLTAVALGNGTTILPAHFCLLPHPGVRYESLSFFMPEGDIVALTRKQSRSESIQVFISILRKQAGIRYQRKFWKTGHESCEIAFPGTDRRKSIRRKPN
jgi:DNA-binding transcriptional LysR family regulator